MEISQQYTVSIAILAVTVFKLFGIEIANETITGIIVGVLAIWGAIKRHQQGDINVLGVKTHAS